jgi:uncharacterized membrane protein YbhN (UPF0104 family)
MKKTKLRPLILWLVSLAVVLSFVYYVYINIDKYIELLRLSAGGMLSIFLIALSFPFINAIQNTLVYRELGADIAYWDGLMITAASTLINQLPIPGGIISKGVYLKKQFRLSYTLFASSIVALFLCFISVSGFFGLVILAYWLLSGSGAVPLSLLVGYLAMAFSFTLFWIPVKHTWLSEKIQIKLKQAADGWKVLGRNPVLLMRLIGFQALLMILLAFRYWFAFQMLSQRVTLSQVLIFSTASILTQLASIAPGGIGVRELIVGAVAGVLGFDVSVGVLAAGLDRLMSTLVVFLTGWISVVLLGKQFTEKMNDADEANSTHIL